MSIEIKKASRSKVKIKMAFEGAAGSGKTYSALLTGKGLCGDYEKICVIDTENGSASLYSHLGEFSVIDLAPPFSPERFIEAIKAAEKGFDVIIIDSASAEWVGKGGVLDIHSGMAGNSFTNWSKLTPRHQQFVDAILQSPAHVICNLRTKTDYVLVEKNGRQVPEKVGLKPETRENLDFEMTVVFAMDKSNNATASKDRTMLFYNKPQFVPSEETGSVIKQWCEQGVDASAIQLQNFSDKVAACNTKEDIITLYNLERTYIDTTEAAKKIMSDRRDQITK
jgi:hypothetical protein